MTSRRAWLQFLAGSPLLAGGSLFRDLLAAEPATAAQALDVFDMERIASRVVPPAHWGYLQSGVDGETTLRANQSGFSKWQLETRRFVDVSRVDLATSLFGASLASPVIISPIGSLRALHVLGDLGVARAARAKNQQHMVSTQMSDRIEDIATERGAPLWYQLYTTNRTRCP
jgi:4-hydroxymandelate oxidase